MTLQSSTRLRRRSRPRFHLTGAVSFALGSGLLVFGAAPAPAAVPLFPNMAHPVGSFPIAVQSADLDGDGIRDLVVANRWDEDLSLLRGLGGGDFARQVRVPAGGIPVAVAVADFDGDGRDDLAVALPVEDSIALFRSEPGGLPGAPILLTAGDSPGAVIAADLNRDGHADLVVTNYLSDDLSIRYGRGDGSFDAPVTLAAGHRPMEIGAALLDGDLYPDLLVASNGTGEILVFRGGAGGFASPVGYSASAPFFPPLPRQILVADVDGDGATDVLAGIFDNDVERNWVVFLPGQGDGSLGAGEMVAISGDGNFALGVADFDRDGRPDLAYGAHHGAVCCDFRGGRIGLGRGDGTFETSAFFRTGVGPVDLVVDDFNADGIPDLAALSDIFWGQVSVNLGRGDGTMGREPESIDPAHAIQFVAIGDIDGDGRLDIAASRVDAAQVRVHRGLGAGLFAAPALLSAGSQPREVVVRDLNGDHLDDVAVWNLGSDSVSYFRSTGGGGFAPGLTLLADEGLRGLAAGDATGDGIADLIVPSGSAGGRIFVVSLPGGAGSASLILPAGVDDPRSAAVGDFDGDGAADIAVVGDLLALLHGVGPSLFENPVVVAGDASNEGNLRVADLDGDGRDDLVAVAGDTPGVRFYRGLAAGGFAPSILLAHQSQPRDLALADLDGDGGIDIATIDGAFEQADLSIAIQPLAMTGPVARRILVQANSGAVAAGDVDGDGRVDLVVPSLEAGVGLIRNQGPFPNRAPRAVPAASTMVECASPGGAMVTLDGRGSTDPDSTSPAIDDIASYEWFEDFDTPGERLVATGALVDVTLPLGGHDLTLRVTDRAGASDAAIVIVSVIDSIAPTAGAALFPARLWPPNHKYTSVRANLSATDACGPVSVTLIAAGSSEPDDLVGGGDGATRDDIAGAVPGTSDFEVLLRAERNGLGAGRTYRLTYRIEDASGNATEASAEVFVPISQSGRGGTIGPPPGHGSSSGGANSGAAGHGNSHRGGPRPRPGNRPE